MEISALLIYYVMTGFETLEENHSIISIQNWISTTL